MKFILVTAIAMLSLSAFANHYEGKGKDTEFGIEVCEMNVSAQQNGKMKLEIFALGEVFNVVVPQDAKTFKINTLSSEMPKAKMTGTGYMDNGKPVLVKIKSARKIDQETLVEESECNF